MCRYLHISISTSTWTHPLGKLGDGGSDGGVHQGVDEGVEAGVDVA